MTDQGVYPRPLEASTLVHVTVSDSNDNAPVFQNVPASMEISENQTPPQTIGQLFATDRDEGENARISYALLNYTGMFLRECTHLSSMA